ncbi:MAG: glycosyltransferase family 2 protein [Candidatus Bathyarchaeota archaeon]|nr:glycosyltransferase family 2 protein [Candidatus Bathyarchaeota archaeon]
MKVSVVIPALNEEGMIEECLKSIRRQDQQVELILIDNGSVDRTPEIAREHCDKVYVKPGYSLAEMRDFGVHEATGDIIVTTDADCVAPHHWITELIKPFEDPNVVAVGGAFRPINRNQLSRFYCWISSLTQGFLGLYQGANMAYRKDVYLKSPGYAGAKRAEDWNLSWYLQRYGKTKFMRRAYTLTEIPVNRQIEYPGGILSAALALLGGALGWLNLVGFGVGFIASEISTFVYRHRSNLRRSHIAALALAVVYFFKRAIPVANFMFIVGTLAGVFTYHFISEDIRFAIEDLKLYKLRKEPDPSLTGIIKKGLIRIMGL